MAKWAISSPTSISSALKNEMLLKIVEGSGERLMPMCGFRNGALVALSFISIWLQL